MRTEYFYFVHHSTTILVKLRIWCFEHSGDISSSLPVNLTYTDESWEGRNTCLWIYTLNLFIEHFGENWWEQNISCSFTKPQAFCHSSAPGALSTLVTSVIRYSLTRARLMSAGKGETRVCGCTLWIYSLSTLENTNRNKIFFFRSSHHKCFVKSKHLMLWALWWYQLFPTP